MDVERANQAAEKAPVSLETWEKVVAISALVAALCALPLPPIAEGPEIASTLAVCAVAAVAGLRWGLAIVVVCEVLLLATFAPFVLHADAGDPLRFFGIASFVTTLPGLWSIRRAAPRALELVGIERTPNTYRAARRLLAAAALLIVALPLF